MIKTAADLRAARAGRCLASGSLMGGNIAESARSNRHNGIRIRSRNSRPMWQSTLSCQEPIGGAPRRVSGSVGFLMIFQDEGDPSIAHWQPNAAEEILC